MNLKTVFGLCLVLGAALFGCGSQVAGGRPVDAGGDGPPDAVADRVLSEPYCPADAAGGGICPINFCGQAQAAASLPANQFPESGADNLCNGGRVCLVGPVLPAGNGFQLVCAAPAAGALAFGAVCSIDPAAGKRCASETLCVTSADDPQNPFCSTMCRNDSDCPTDADGPARCTEHPAATLPNGGIAQVGLCTPRSKISGKTCVREGDCAANEGCLSYGPRTNLRLCRATSGTKSVGDSCSAATQCRSGECYDQSFHLAGVANRTFCSSACAVSSDCGANQQCVRLVVGDNGTTDNPLDDVLSGYCQTLFPPLAANDCHADGDCVSRANGSDTCDTAHGDCYRLAALPGDACTADTECPIGGVCSTGPRFTGGYCKTFGCAPGATTGVDACLGARSTCAERGGPDEPIAACYEGCGSNPNACSRASAGYGCVPASAGSTVDICLVMGGT